MVEGSPASGASSPEFHGEGDATPATATDRSAKRFRIVAAAIVLTALLLRLFYALDAKVQYPIEGDVTQYVTYAWHMRHDGTFSMSLPDGGHVVPDSFRGPGYPFLLMAMMGDAGGAPLDLTTTHTDWIDRVCEVQALFGAFTVWLTIAVARFWLARGPALCAGALTAFWPHLISFSGVLLSETLFGFVLLLAVWLLLLAQRNEKPWCAACSGLAFGIAYLVNPVMALFPLLAAGALLFGGRTRIAVVLLAAYLLAPAGWALRNESVANGAGSYERAARNFVQGSWPEYFAAYNARYSNPVAHAVVRAEGDEERTFIAHPGEGAGMIGARMRLDPAHYLTWYIARKPFLLWDWNVRMGWGDVYFLPTTVSPFTRVRVLEWMKATFAALNPAFFALALAATLGCVWRLARSGWRDGFAAGTVALLALYVTFVHTALQAEPRYSVPYRPEELLMSVTAAAWLIARVASRFGEDRARPWPAQA